MIWKPQKRNYDTKISNIQAKYFMTSDYYKFSRKILHKKIKEKRLADTSNISRFVDNSNLDKKGSNISNKIRIKE